MAENTAVYAGSFDPPTNGHLWMIRQGARLFDHLTVAIGVNPEKRCMFTVQERIDMLAQFTRQFSNVVVTGFTNQFLIAYADLLGAQFILRGIRNESDFGYERAMRNINGDQNDRISTVFLMPPRGIADVSSSMVKGLIGPEGWEDVVKRYVPEYVFEKLKEAHRATSS